MKSSFFIQHRTMIVLSLALSLNFPADISYAGINEDLSAVDAVIQLSPTPIRITGQAAYNIYQGADTVQLEQKRQLLNSIGITSFSSAGRYSNFYSFTGTAGYTDTQITVTTLSSPLRLYRRGSTAYQETQSYLGRWWGDQYRGIEATRNEQAVLASWGSDLNRIYVIDVPTNTTLIGGFAAPMESNGEYRAGGAYQYFYQGAQNSWLVYALYAPDYLKSYSSAITGAQRVSQNVATDLGLHMNQLRSTVPKYDEKVPNNKMQEGDIWYRAFGADVDYGDGGQNLTSQRKGMSLGWDRMVTGWKQGDKVHSYVGVLLGQGHNDQENRSNSVENKVTTTYGGIYGVYINRPENARSWYGNYSLLYGNVNFSNKVPGEMGYGLNQDYTGKMMAFTVENGVTFKRRDGLIIEPQLQFSYERITHNPFTDNVGASVVLNKGDSCLGRLGVEARKTIIHSANRQSTYWAKVSYLYNFINKNVVDISGDLAVSETPRKGYLFAIGTNMKLSSSLDLQGEIGKAVGNERGYQGSLALQSKW